MTIHERILAHSIRTGDSISKSSKAFGKGKNFIHQSIMNASTSAQRMFRLRERLVGLPLPYKGGDPKNVLIIGDTHFPFMREGYLLHCREVQERYNCGTVVHIGDVIDNHYSSFHTSDPDGYSAGEELTRVKDDCFIANKMFPEVKVCRGNHDLIPWRKAMEAKLSRDWLHDINDVLGLDGWEWADEWVINNIRYIHGTGTSGEFAAYDKALNRRISTVQGHIHSAANIRYSASHKDIIFGMQVGCGVDEESWAFAYNKGSKKKWIISCGVVIDDKAIIIPMEL